MSFAALPAEIVQNVFGHLTDLDSELGLHCLLICKSLYKHALSLVYENVELRSYGQCGKFATTLADDPDRAAFITLLDIDISCLKYYGQHDHEPDGDGFQDLFCKCWEDEEDISGHVLAAIASSFGRMQPCTLAINSECPLATRAILSSVGLQRLQALSLTVRSMSHSHTDYIAYHAAVSRFLTHAGPRLRHFSTYTTSALNTQIGVMLNIGLAGYPELENLEWMSCTLWELLGTPAIRASSLIHLQLVASDSDDRFIDATNTDRGSRDIVRLFPQRIERLDVSIPPHGAHFPKKRLQQLIEGALADTSTFPALTQILVKYEDGSKPSLLSMASACRRRNINLRFQQVSTTALWSQSPPWPHHIGPSA